MANVSLNRSSTLVDCFGKFQTHRLDPNWVQSVWDGDISLVDFLPNEFQRLHENTDWLSVLEEASNEMRLWIKPVSDSTLAGTNKSLVYTKFEASSVSEAEKLSLEGERSSFWAALTENCINFKSIIIICSFFLERGTSAAAGFTEKQCSIASARLYLCFICVPGSSAYRLFHAVLYQKVMDLFGMAKTFSGVSEATCSGRTTRSSLEDAASGTQSHSVKRKRNTGKNASQKRSKATGDLIRGRQSNENVELDEEIEDCPGLEENATLTIDNVKILTKGLKQLLVDMQLLFKCFSIKHHAQSMDYTIRKLCELLSQEHKYSSDKLMADTQSAIKALCIPFHGSVKEITLLVAKHCLNILLCSANRNIVNFLCSLMKFTPGGDAIPAMQRLIQHLCMKVPERAEARSKVGSMIFVIMNELPPIAIAGTIKWLLSYILGTKVTHRVFALEVIALILGNKLWEASFEDIPPDQQQYLSYTCLLKAVLIRCKDVSATVRAKALSILANCMASPDSVLHSTIKLMFTPTPLARRKLSTARTPGTSEVSDEVAVNVGNMLEDFHIDTSDPQNVASRCKTTGNSATIGNCSETDLPDYETVLELLRRKASDEKVHVRKAAIQVLHHIMELNVENLSVTDVEVLKDHCRDVSLLVRKQALQSLTLILQTCPTSAVLQRAWLQAVLPSILDVETSIQEKCAEFVEEIILKNIVLYQRSNTHNHTMAWTILTAVANDNSDAPWRYLKRVLSYLARSGKLRQNLTSAVCSHIDTENDTAAWLLLSELASRITLKDVDFVYHYWDCHQKSIDDRTDCMNHVLQVLAAVSKRSDDAKLFAYFGKFSLLLEDFACPFAMIPTLVETIYKLCCSAKNTEKSKALFQSLCGRIFKAIDKYLSSVILTRKRMSAEINEDTVIKHLCTLGEVAMMCPNLVPKHIFLLMETILAASCTTQVGNEKDVLGSQGSRPLNQCVRARFSNRMRNFALVAVGKLCLQHENFAKKCVHVLGNELEKSDDPFVRNNIVVILVDLCKRYTTLVDVHFPSITACLKDSSLLVRRQTLALLTQLLQEDYIKWRGSMFFCYLTALVDGLQDIRVFAEYALLHVLTKRHPTMFFQNFVECLFFFNSYEDHEAYNKIAKSEKEAKLFSLVGHENATKRMTLYKFMLEQMTDEHRFHVTTKLCQEILGGVVDDDIKLKSASGEVCVNGQSLVKDTLAVLCCEEIKLASLRASPQEELEDGDFVAAIVVTAKKTIISQVVKKNAVENIVPIVIALKHKLEKLLSPLLQDLMFYLKEMMKDYKNEVKDILAADKQLAKEIDYDLKKFEQQHLEQLEDQQNERNRLDRNGASADNAPIDRNASNSAKEVPLSTAAAAAAAVVQETEIPNSTETPHAMITAPVPTAENNIQQDSRPLESVNPVHNITVVNDEILERSKSAPSKPVGKSLRRLTPKKVCKPMAVEDLTLISQSPSSSLNTTAVTLTTLPNVDQGIVNTEQNRIHPNDNLDGSKKSDNAIGLAVKQEPESVRNDVVAYTPQPSRFQARNMLRAISTPCDGVTNITFSSDTGNGQCARLSPVIESDAVSSPSVSTSPLRQWQIKPLPKRFSLAVEVDDSGDSD